MSVNRTGDALERMCHGIIVLVSVLVPRSRRSGWREEWESEVWHHLHTHGQGSGALPGAALLVRCLGAFPHALWEIDATQPLTRTLDLEQMVGSALAPGRFQALLLGLFSVFAVGLAGVGVYSILAEGVNERRREIGVRMAMGAQPSSVVQEVVPWAQTCRRQHRSRGSGRVRRHPAIGDAPFRGGSPRSFGVPADPAVPNRGGSARELASGSAGRAHRPVGRAAQRALASVRPCGWRVGHSQVGGPPVGQFRLPIVTVSVSRSPSRSTIMSTTSSGLVLRSASVYS